MKNKKFLIFIICIILGGILIYFYKKSSPRICSSKNLGLTFVLPSKDWSCTVDVIAQVTATNEGWINLKSSFFNIDISTYGVQQPICGYSGYDPTCKYLDFYHGDKIDLTITNYNGVDKNIVGQYKIGNSYNNIPDGKPSVTVTYANIENQKLTDTEKRDLINLLESAY